MEEGSRSEFQDWEVLHEYDDTFPQVHSSHFPDSNSRLSLLNEGGDSGSGRTIWLDYFSLRNHEPSAKTVLESTASQECLVESENLNPNDTESEHRNCRKKMNELNQSHANVLADITESVTGFEEITTDERREADEGKLSGSPIVVRDEPLCARSMYTPVVPEESGEENVSQSSEESVSQDDEVLDDSYSNSSGNESVAMKSGDDGNESDTGSDRIDSVNDLSNKAVAIEEAKVEAQRRWVVWWKLPFQVLRYWFLRATPACFFSMAAAFMGMVILGRRLYKMKRKSKGLRLKIAVDDKKVWRFADQAARLNEAFSAVRRVPAVRASLTGTGASSWPAMSMW